MRTKVSLADVWKQLRWSSDCGQGLQDCSRRTAQQWQKPGGGRTCWVGDVVRAVDFAQRNRDVSGWTVANAKAYNTCIAPQAAYRSCSGAVHVTDSGTQWTARYWGARTFRHRWTMTTSLTSHDLWRQTSGASHVAAASVHDQTCPS